MCGRIWNHRGIWLAKQKKTLMVPENALTIENVSILQLRAALQVMKAYLFFEQEADITAEMARSSIYMGHTAEDSECLGHTMMSDNVVCPLHCGDITVHWQ